VPAAAFAAAEAALAALLLLPFTLPRVLRDGDGGRHGDGRQRGEGQRLDLSEFLHDRFCTP
jgi:hypothetical protein